MPLRRHLDIAHRTVVYAIASGVVLLAIVLAAVSQLLPLVARNPERIEAWLSERVRRPVAFDAVTTDWTRRGPVLALQNLRIGEGRNAFAVGDAEMLVSMYSGLLPGGAFSELRVRNLDLTVEREDDGRWHVRGMPGQQSGGDPLDALERLGELHIIGARLNVDAPALGIRAMVPRADVRLRVGAERVRAGVRAWPSLDGPPLDAVLHFERGSGNGRVHAGGQDIDLAAWSAWLRVAGVGVAAGKGRAQGWATLRDGRVTRVEVATDLRGVQMASVAASAERVGFDRIEALARWRMDAGTWRVDAPTLRVAERTRTHVLDGLVIAGGATRALLAERVDAAPLIAVAALSDRLPGPVRAWLRSARPGAVLHDVAITGLRGGGLRARGRFEDAGFAAVDATPGLRGLDATFEADADGIALEFDGNAVGVFDWRPAFGTAHPLRLDGRVTAWRHGAGWRIGTSALDVDLGELALDARGAVTLQGDASRPHIALAATVAPFAVASARRYWVRHRMAPATLRWLDEGLLGGRVSDGRVLLVGDLDDWPFANASGVFEATVQVRDGTVRFQREWPAVEDVDASVQFVANGLDVQGSGRLSGLAVRHVTASIDRFDGGTLTVNAVGGGDATQLRALLRASPLYVEHSATLDNLDARGPADASFNLALPLQPGSRARIDGDLTLRGATLADERWKIAFDRVDGRATYSNTGFVADGLRVRQDGQPGRLSLRAGSNVRDAAHVFEGGLDAPIATATLLARAPDLAWLRPYVDGRSTWTVGVAIPRGAPGQPATARLRLRSDLVGTSLSLPAPLAKAAAQAMDANVDTPLPLGSGEVRVTLASTLDLRARSANGATGVRVALGGARADAPPASGLVASGRAPALDAIGWIGVIRGRARPSLASGAAASASNPPAAPLALQRIDVTAQRLLLLGGTFRDTRLRVVPAPGGATAVRVDGPSLAGAVLVPASSTQPVAGRFERVHWAGLQDATTTSTAVAVPPAARRTAASGDADIDPAAIPPLNFDIDDLRFGSASLGSASVRTQPTAGGLRVDQMQARTRAQTLSVTGTWLGRGASARTRMALDVDSRDIGALLDGFGLRGRVDGGTGRMAFTAAWPGSPDDFRVATVEGGLTLDARKGRLLEVEPGAGRVLGLLSIAELPRRLTLDFRDFFDRGFAFNRITGGVRFDGGMARAEAMTIDGPAAVIDIRGTANLRAQSFDQTLEVRPKAGGLLAVAGAVAGGPVGAAIGAAAGAVLRKPLGQIGAKTYRVTGPWKDPKVEVVSRDQSRLLRPADPAG